MKKTFKFLFFLSLLTAFIFTSCSTNVDEVIIEESPKSFSKKNTKLNTPTSGLSAIRDLPSTFTKDFVLDLEKAVIPSECGPTAFNDVINASISSNIDQLGADWYGDYADINFYYTLTDDSEQYFGNNGQYTNYVNNRTRNLEKFWSMPNEISVRGQHNETLNDRNKIIETLVFWYGFPQGLAEFYADYFINFINVESTFLIESPLVSFDGFAIALGGLFGQGDIIVIGDGLVELASEAGVEDKIVWSGILAHEWAHQIQFDYGGIWYPNGAADNAPEATRTTELEADFFAAYYMTHKRGATYNWKRVEDFFELFFNIGDCSFTSSGHHGTPIQRMEAARQGYLLAASAQKKGKILTPDQVHDAFLNILVSIVN